MAKHNKGVLLNWSGLNTAMLYIDTIKVGRQTRVLGKNEAVRQSLKLARRAEARKRLARMKTKDHPMLVKCSICGHRSMEHSINGQFCPTFTEHGSGFLDTTFYPVAKKC